ncbi:MAG TPA: hypothetical protein PK289_00870 [Bacteroidia bacterium]|nr:hypothetical protein [Bacteroidia bacterium]
MLLRLRLTLFCYFFICYSWGQTTAPSANVDFQQQLEDIVQQTQQEEPDYSALIELLAYYHKHPINLNHTTKEELQNLNLLSDLQINQLFSHIENNGKLMHLLELQTIDGFDQNVIHSLLPYIYVNDSFNTIHFHKKDSWKEVEQTLTFRYSQVLEKQSGFRPIDKQSFQKNPNSRYIGSPQKLYAHYQVRFNTHLSAGFTAEKDAGEAFLKKKIPDNLFPVKMRNGFDFYSAHLFLHHVKCIQALVVGDYTITFGQGLTVWNGASFGKSSAILYAKKTAQGIRPYSSVDENKFMRGVATTLRQKKFFLTLFYSRKTIDANVIDTTQNGNPSVVSSLQQTGIHATIAELNDKHSVYQTVLGTNLSYHSNRFHIGLTGVHDYLNLTLKPTLRADNQFNSASTKNTNLGLDYNYIFQNFNFFGEGTRNKNGSVAFLNGVFISLHSSITFTAVHRCYTARFQNAFNAGFSESGASNEKGLYMGLTIQLPHALSLTSCYDRFEFAWLRYQVDAPSHGHDVNTQLTYTPSKKWNALFRVSQRNNMQNTGNDVAMKYMIRNKYTGYRFTMSYQVTTHLKLANRVEVIHVQSEQNNQKGYLLYQDIHYKKPGKPFAAILRYAIFQTDGYDARIYAYENDVSGAFAIPAYFDSGSRFYILLNYTFNKHVEFWVRYSQTVYDNKEVISEGTLSEIRGNKKSEVKVQVRVKF